MFKNLIPTLKKQKVDVRSLILLIILTSLTSVGQTAFKNFGNIKMHEDAAIGFHTDFINDGICDNDNLGFVGFYSDDEIRQVSGNNRAVFYDVEIDTENDLLLNTSLGIANELAFINGKVLTPRNDIGVSLDFINHNFYAGEDGLRLVDGYASNTGNTSFTFPLGYENEERLRPMSIGDFDPNSTYQGAYFFENPSFPSTFATNFTTTTKDFQIDLVSSYEFWDLNGTELATVTLTWDEFSAIEQITQNLTTLIVVGWNNTTNQWENLGNTALTGDLDSGSIASIPFVPNNYEVITFGATRGISPNFLISPNGDELNETVYFEELDEFEYGELTIFNRWGNLVFYRKDYQNDFDGTSEGRATVYKDEKLPVGTYFYELNYGDDESYGNYLKGWIYINR